MSRIDFDKQPKTLEVLIPSYYQNKQELDSYTKICNEENGMIKELMANDNKDVCEVSGIIAKRTVCKRESLNEDKLIEVLRKHNIEGVIQTKEYVNMDALEDYLYNSTISPELAKELDDCRKVTEVVQLRVSRKKKGD